MLLDWYKTHPNSSLTKHCIALDQGQDIILFMLYYFSSFPGQSLIHSELSQLHYVTLPFTHGVWPSCSLLPFPDGLMSPKHLKYDLPKMETVGDDQYLIFDQESTTGGLGWQVT